MPQSRSTGNKATHALRHLKGLDMFSQRMPSFNLAGETSVTTYLGTLFTILTVCTLVVYGLVQFVELWEQSNPRTSTIISENEFDTSYQLNLNERKFRVAVAVQGKFDQKSRHDPRYVQWVPRIYERKDGVESQTILPWHTCTEQDFTEFYPVSKAQQKLLVEAVSDAEKSMVCIEWDDETPYLINGNRKDGDFKSLDFQFIPCNVKLDPSKEVSEGCVADLAAQIDYLSEVNLVLLASQERFNLLGYGDKAIVRESKMQSVAFDTSKPNFIESKIQLNELDEVSVFTLWNSLVTEFFTLDVSLPQASSYIDFPSDQSPDLLYKFTSLDMQLDSNLRVTNRQAYSVLDWLGDIGGLLEAIKAIFFVLMLPFEKFSLSNRLMTALFKQKLLNDVSNPRKPDTDQLKESVPIKPHSWFKSVLFRDKRQRLMRRMAVNKLQSELDLTKFISRQKLLLKSIVALLSENQIFLLLKQSELTLDHGKDGDSDSDDSFFSKIQKKDKSVILREMSQSECPVDARLLRSTVRTPDSSSFKPLPASETQVLTEMAENLSREQSQKQLVVEDIVQGLELPAREAGYGSSKVMPQMSPIIPISLKRNVKLNDISRTRISNREPQAYSERVQPNRTYIRSVSQFLGTSQKDQQLSESSEQSRENLEETRSQHMTVDKRLSDGQIKMSLADFRSDLI